MFGSFYEIFQDQYKEYFFILDLKKPDSEEENDIVEFTKITDKENLPKCILTKEENDKMVKIYKFNSKLIKDNKASFEFFFNRMKYKLSLDNIKDKTFLFGATILTSTFKEIDQTKIDLPEKMNYFDEALNIQKENEKMNILYSDSINLLNKKLSFHFLINIFVKVYNTELCSKLLESFSKNIADLVDKINKESLQKYKFDFDQIVENEEDIISKYNLNKIDFHGLVLCYLNYCNKEKYRELIDKLSKNDENKKYFSK